MSFLFRPQALDDLRTLLEHIAKESPQAALRMRDRILETCTLLGDNPSIAAELEGLSVTGVRRFPVKHYPRYSIFYQINNERVEIIRLGYGGRDWEHTI